MTKRSIIAAIILLVMSCALSVTGCSYFSTDDEITYKDVEGGKALTRYEGNSSHESLVIPAEVNGKPVVELADYAVSAAEYLKTITIGKNVKTISYRAFCGTVRNLTAYVVDEENPYFCSVDGVIFNKEKTVLVAYPNMKAGTEYRIPDGVTTIAGCAFYMCSNLTKVTFPDSIKKVDEYAFFKCGGLQRIELNEGLEEVCRDGFSFTEGLLELHLPSTLKKIGDYGFYAKTSKISSFTTKRRVEDIDCGKSWRPQTTGMGNSALTPSYVGK